MKKKILLMHISKVSGHRSAALAVENAVKILEPQAEVLNIDILNYTNPISGKITNSLYMGMIKNLPWLWAYLYDNPKIIAKLDGYKKFLHHRNLPKLKLLCDDFSPQVVACTQAFPCGMMADFKKALNPNLSLVGILTDFVPHAYWVYDLVDYYITPSDEVSQRLTLKGVLPEHIKALGIPFDPKFNQAIDKDKVLEKLGLDRNLPIVLIMGGGHGLGPLKTVVDSLEDIPVEIQEIVVAGVNQNLCGYLKRKARKSKQKIVALGYVDNIHELMSVSTMIITKPGGITTAEALAKGLPMIVIKPIPGQEENNTVYLIREGAAVRLDEPKDIGLTVVELLADTQRLNNLRRAALAMSKPNAAMDIARLILGLCR